MSLTGQLGMDAALERVETDEWLARARRAVTALAEVGSFTAEDVRRLAGDPPGSGNALGALLHAVRREGLIVQDGWEETRRREARGRVIRRWRRR